MDCLKQCRAKESPEKKKKSTINHFKSQLTSEEGYAVYLVELEEHCLS